jgi:TPR repeat protein
MTKHQIAVALGLMVFGCAQASAGVDQCAGISAPTLKVAFKDSQLPARDEAEIVTSLQIKSNQGDVDAMNRLGIMYAQGRGVAKNYDAARKWFLQSALRGYPPAMVNLGSMYQHGAGGRQSRRLAYAWLRVALVFGMPEEDHDASVFKLGMVAGQIGPANVQRGERLAAEIVERLTRQCGCASDRCANAAYGWGMN